MGGGGRSAYCCVAFVLLWLLLLLVLLLLLLLLSSSFVVVVAVVVVLVVCWRSQRLYAHAACLSGAAVCWQYRSAVWSTILMHQRSTTNQPKPLVQPKTSSSSSSLFFSTTCRPLLYLTSSSMQNAIL